MYYQHNMDFSEWIVNELEKRGWSRSEAARRGGISPSMFDKVINGNANPGVKFIDGIAKAFRLTPSEVMMHVTTSRHDDPWVEEMTYKLRQIAPGLRGVAETVIDGLVEGKQPAQPQSKPKHRSSTT